MERLLLEESDFESFLERYDEAVEAAVAGGVVALKSIIAYRSGLVLEETAHLEAEASFRRLSREARLQGACRLEDKTLLDWAVRRTVELAGRLEVPVQFHTGFGDADLDLRLANPLHLRPLLEDKSARGTSIVLLHAGYPYVRETAYLASLYPNVFVGVSLAVPLLSYGAVAVLTDLLSLAPWTKVLYGSDGYTLPESYWLGALRGREVVAEAVGQMVAFGSLTHEEALEAATAVLAGNARVLYGLGGAGIT